MLSHLLTFAIFLVIGLEIREGVKSAASAALPAISALGGMVLPALFYLLLSSDKSAWATAMPTDVALAIGALSLLGKRVNPAVRLFLLTLAIADDAFSLAVIAIFFHNDLDLQSAFYTLGAAAIGALLPSRALVLKYLAPVVSFAIVPAYIWINVFADIQISQFASRTSIALAVARVAGKAIGITATAYIFTRWTRLQFPQNLELNEVFGIGLLAGMGMSVSLVIADITVSDSQVITQIHSGLLIAAALSAALGLAWLKRFPADVR